MFITSSYNLYLLEHVFGTYRLEQIGTRLLATFTLNAVNLKTKRKYNPKLRKPDMQDHQKALSYQHYTFKTYLIPEKQRIVTRCRHKMQNITYAVRVWIHRTFAEYCKFNVG